nr:hypothetical protein [Deltaproteobacteria bacterium]
MLGESALTAGTGSGAEVGPVARASMERRTRVVPVEARKSAPARRSRASTLRAWRCSSSEAIWTPAARAASRGTGPAAST